MSKRGESFRFRFYEGPSTKRSCKIRITLYVEYRSTSRNLFSKPKLFSELKIVVLMREISIEFKELLVVLGMIYFLLLGMYEFFQRLH